jgi:predicted small lipoprotein YifL
MLTAIQELFSVSLCFRLSFARLAMIGALAAALGLTACGRKGPLDPPPSAAVAQPAEAAPAGSGPGSGVNPMTRSTPTSPQAFDSEGRPIAASGPKKRLPLDWLLD